MEKNKNPLKFTVLLDGELAELFTKELVRQERTRTSLTRIIFKDYFKYTAMREEFEEFRQLRDRGLTVPPHFGGGNRRSSRQSGAA